MIDKYKIRICKSLLRDYSIWKERYLSCLMPETSRPDVAKVGGQPEDKGYNYLYYQKKIEQVERVLNVHPEKAAYIYSHYDLPKKMDDSWNGIVSSLYFLACSM